MDGDFDVFVSYETSESLSLARLAKGIFAEADRSAYVWHCDKTVGALMYSELARRIDAASYFLYICTEKSAFTWPQQWELNKALYDNKTILGIAFDWGHVPSEVRHMIGEEISRDAFPEVCARFARDLHLYLTITKSTKAESEGESLERA